MKVRGIKIPNSAMKYPKVPNILKRNMSLEYDDVKNEITDWVNWLYSNVHKTTGSRFNPCLNPSTIISIPNKPDWPGHPQINQETSWTREDKFMRAPIIASGININKNDL